MNREEQLNQIEIQFKDEKAAIQKELQLELNLGNGHHYTERANELYKQLRELTTWYNEEKRRLERQQSSE